MILLHRLVARDFKQLADVWVDSWQLSDDELADRIQADKVDILIDVSGHSTGNRLPVFARKPAPIQVTGFGHATGTGLQAMDYVLADPIFIPESARHLLAEKVHDLPCLITTDPILDVPPSELPMLRNGYVTFGVFNRISKISDEAIRVWSKAMREVSGSKIIIKHTLLDDPLLRDRLIARWACDEERLGADFGARLAISASLRRPELSRTDASMALAISGLSLRN